MQCNILKHLYLKSNGDIRCDDDYGERILLGRISAGQPFSPTQFFSSRAFNDIKLALAENRPPWGDVCQQCVFYRSGKIEDTFQNKLIRKIQIEPSLLCALRCPACSRIEQLKAGRKPALLSKDILKNLLDGLLREQFQIEMFEFCGQGEPLDHPNFPELCQMLNRAFPSAQVNLVTNGNFIASEKLSGCDLTEIIVSIDGAEQSSYEQYRRKGHISRCVAFATDAKKMLPNSRVIWKYILFSHNDSDREILLAQKMADQIGVDEIRFVHTEYGPASKRLIDTSASKFPLVLDIASLDSHLLVSGIVEVAHLQAVKPPLKKGILRPLRRLLKKTQPKFKHSIDRVCLIYRNDQHFISVDGWIIKKSATAWAGIRIGDSIKDINCIFRRSDVMSVHKTSLVSGFRELIPIPERALSSNLQLVMEVRHRGTCNEFTYDCQFTSRVKSHTSHPTVPVPPILIAEGFHRAHVDD